MNEAKEINVKIAVLLGGNNVIYKEKKGEMEDVMFIEPKANEQGMTFLNFTPLCMYGQEVTLDPFRPEHVMATYVPSDDVIRIYTLFLDDYAKARQQAEAARAAAAETGGNITPMATARMS